MSDIKENEFDDMDESGFENDGSGSENSKPEKVEGKVDAVTSNKSSFFTEGRKKGIAIASVALFASLGGLVYLNTTKESPFNSPGLSGGGKIEEQASLPGDSNDFAFLNEPEKADEIENNKTLQSMATSDGLDMKPSEPDEHLSVVKDSSGVSVNGYHDIIATMLLENHPTKEDLRNAIKEARGIDVTQAEMDAFLLSVKSNASDIRQIKRMVAASQKTDNTEVLAAIRGLKDESRQQMEILQALKSEVSKLKKNSGWYHNRITVLEGGPRPKAKSQVKKSAPRRVELKNEITWSVKGASEHVAFIKNNNTNKSLRVTRGFDVPGCGQVTDINPGAQRVTTTRCVIKN